MLPVPSTDQTLHWLTTKTGLSSNAVDVMSTDQANHNMMLPAVCCDSACCEELHSCDVYGIYVTVFVSMSQVKDVTLAVIVM